MLRDRQHVWRRLNLLGDILLTYAALLTAILLFDPDLSAFGTGLLFITTSVAWTAFLYGPSGSYFYRMKPITRILRELLWGLSKSFSVFIIVPFFTGIDIPARMTLAIFALDVAFLTLSRLTLSAGLNLYRSRGRSNRNVIIIGSGERAGLITYHTVEKSCEIVALNSLREGQGVGTSLIRAVQNMAVKQGCERVWLITTNDNTAALRFFQRRGFVLVAIHRNALDESRKLKPEIPATGMDGIPLRDEIELEMSLQS